MNYIAEYTDTFGGEANYSWVRRATLVDMPKMVTKRQLMRAARKALGLEGVRGHIVGDYGNILEFRPYGMCTVLFISPEYD